jgi:uncharacterized membrane protein YhaH (DUF805 family)
MDILLEFILGLLFELPLDAAMESKRLKTGVKTAVFALLGGLLVAFFAFLTVQTWQSGGGMSGIVMTLITISFAILIVWGAIDGHKRDWKRKW